MVKKKKITKKSEQQIIDLENQLRRLAAEFDNYRKRTDEEKQQVVQLAQSRTLLELCPVLDNFRRATEHLPQHLVDDNWVKGVLYVEKQLEQIFEQFGVKKIKTVGEAFNPQFHEAISSEPSGTVPEHTILNEVESGYEQQGKVLKPAKVIVSAGPQR